MSRDRETRRTAAVLVCVVIMTVLSGCRRSPFQRLTDGSAGAPATTSAASTGTVRPELPALAAVHDNGPIGDGVWSASSRSSQVDAEPPVSLPTVSAPTPLLDAALKRAEAEEQLQREAIRAQQPAADASPAGGPKVQTVSVVTRPQAQSASLKVQPQPEDSRAENGESDLVAAPLDPEPASAKPADPAAVWAESLDRLKAVARESARQPGPGEAAALWLVRSQVVEWLASETLRPAGQALLRRAVLSMADATTTPAVDAATRSAEIRSAVLALEDRVPFGITELRLCRKVLGFGAFELLDGPVVKGGQPVLLYCELSGLRYQTVDQAFVSRLSSRVELVTAKDGLKVWEQSLGEAEDRCRSRRRDYYVNYRFTIPTNVAPGDYRIRLTQTDLVASQTASAELPLTIPN